MQAILKATKQLKAEQKRMGAARDKLRDLLAEIEGVYFDCETAMDDINDAVCLLQSVTDTLSKDQ